MEGKEYQKKELEVIYRDATLAPVFKTHPKYNVNRFADMVPYIAYGDIMDNKYIIRGRPHGSFNTYDSEKREIIVEYDNMDDLINDGWRLD